MSFTFDTLAYVRKLRDAKVPPAMAEAMADALTETFNAPNGVATKGDIALLKGDIALLRQDIAALQNKLLLRLGGLMIAVAGLGLTLSKVL